MHACIYNQVTLIYTVRNNIGEILVQRRAIALKPHHFLANVKHVGEALECFMQTTVCFRDEACRMQKILRLILLLGLR